MVLVMMLLFLVTGARAEKIDRWVTTGLVAAISLVLLITYVRF